MQPTVRTGLTLILIAVGVLVGLWLLTKVWAVLLLVAVALLLATPLLGVVDWLAPRVHNRALAVALVMVAVLGALALLLLLVVPPTIAQGRELWERAPELRDRTARFAEQRGWEGLRDRIQTFQPGEQARRFGPRLLGPAGTAVGLVVALLTVFFLVAYFLLDAPRVRQFVSFSTPRRWHPHIDALLPALRQVVGGYIKGQAITSGAIFVFTVGLLLVLRVPNPLGLAAIAAVVDLIPVVGVFILLALVGLAALSVSVTKAVIVVAALVLYQQFEDRLLVPRVYGQTLHLPPLVVVLAVLFGAQLLGLLGALLALPVAAGIRVVIEHFAAVRRHRLERPTNEDGVRHLGAQGGEFQ